LEEEDGRGKFKKMMERQSKTGGFLPEKDIAVAAAMDVEDVLKQQEEEEGEEVNEKLALLAHLKHKRIAICPLSLGNWMFYVIADLTSTKPAVASSPPPLSIATNYPAKKTGGRLTIQVPSSPITESQFKFPAALRAACGGSN
jgi:ATP-binding cassette subfamily B (MDR/TAP) protein 1